MTNISPTSLSDSDLLAETASAACVERRSTAELIAFLAEIDLRKLYLGQGYSSLFTYCTQSLHLSESAAYARITVARAARTFPILLPLLTAGAVTLTTVSLLSAHLTAENCESLLTAASHKNRREVEHLVASLISQPDVRSSVRRLPARSTAAPSIGPTVQALLAATNLASPNPTVQPQPEPRVSTSGARRPVLAPLSADRYFLRVTLSAHGHEMLERARALLRHQLPGGDPAVIVDRALTTLVEQLERTKHAATSRPRAKTTPPASTSRYVPAEVKRTVWDRLSRVSPHHTVRGGRPDRRDEPRAALPGAQCVRGDSVRTEFSCGGMAPAPSRDFTRGLKDMKERPSGESFRPAVV